MDLSRRLRGTALVLFLVTLLVNTVYSKYHGRRHKRQNGAHLYHPDNFIIPGGDGDIDEWGHWSSPSECSRSCGGGVAYQQRECRRFGPNGAPLCRGGNRKYFSCNTQDCPEDEPDFRIQQCSRFNNVPFEGIRYDWVPYTKAPNPCELNCMPKGERFYYRHKAKVIDGTRCNDESLDVCVDGKCQHVGCDMMLGSQALEDKCRKCDGDGSSCKTVSGVFDQNNLQVGYNDILLVPAGASNILIEEVAPSNNYLACRNLSSHYYLNGNWRIDFPRPMNYAGSWWHYERKPQGFAAPDHLSCVGPTTESIYIVLLYQDRNVGIKYEYSVPESFVKNTPDTYTWSQTEFGPCNVSCGGGTQSRQVICTSRITLDNVEDSLCDATTKPEEMQKCGLEACAPNWVEGVWGKCSKSCGEDGKQNRTVTCERVSPNGVATKEDDSVCLKLAGNKPADTQECNRDIANCPKYHTGPWTPCDKLCGEGKQTRKVTCYIEENKRKRILPEDDCAEEKPETEIECTLTPCEGVDWIVSQWSGCNNCGQTKETRTATCSSKSGKVYEDKFCSENKPELTQECKSSRCEYQWFSSQWSKCSASCGKGVQSRIVICGKFDEMKVTPAEADEQCDASIKPEAEQECEGEEKECPGEWFTGPWGACNKPCGGGERTREVLCLSNGTTSSNCDETKIEFNSEKCNVEDCTVDEVIPVDVTSKSITVDDDENEECDEDYSEEDDSVSGFELEAMKVSDGIDLDSTGAKETTLVDDELMYSDATGLETESTGLSETTVEGSADGFSTIEGSGDDDEEATTTPVSEGTSVSGAATDSSTDVSDVSSEQSTDGSTNIPETTLSASDSTDLTLASDLTTSSDVSDSTDKPTTDSSASTDSGTDSTDSSSDSTNISTDSSGSGTTDSSTETSGSTDDSTSTGSSDSTNGESTSDESTETPTESSGLTTDESLSTVDSSSSASSITMEESTSSDPISTATSDSTEETSSTVDSSSSASSTTMEESTSSVTSDSTEETLSTVDSSSSASSIAMEESTSSVTIDSTEETLSTVDSSSSASSITLEESTSSGPISTATSDSTEEILSTVDSSSPASALTMEESTTSDPISTVTSDSTEKSESTDASGSTDASDSTDISTSAGDSEATTISSSTDASDATDSTDAISTTETSETTSSPSSDATTVSSSETEATEPTVTDGTGSTVSESTDESSETTESSTDKSSSTEVDIWSTTDSSSVDDDDLKSTAITLEDVLKKESKPRTCKRRKPKTPDCKSTEFGCCPDGKTVAKGPFDEGCPISHTCKDTKHGCCPDGVSPAQGKDNKGCPKSQCAETLFGCCPDNFTPAEGEEDEGCPEPTTTVPPTTTEIPEEEKEEEISTAAPDGQTDDGSDTSEKSCSFSEFGCCPDGTTSADGEFFSGCPSIDKKDCNGTEFGCCSDGKTTASGPDNKGCEPCTTEPFGCCQDGKTPAHGPNHEGCCTSTEFGCCADNINAARGPNNEGCECYYSPFGCCPDKKTASRGYNNEGCGCQDTQFGCCPDKITAATGEKFSGCPCHTMQFGCCPDGITIPQGPHHYGCHCSETEHKCCSDGITPAKGPNFEGCTCAESKFGCCPDGVTDAMGKKFEGCENLKEAPQKACALPKETGTCSNFTVKYFFDTAYGACARFWYGGCDGNGNRFDSAADCKATCEDFVGKESCLLPKSSGPCPEFNRMWYYDADRSRCEQFNYGGCFGNTNRFETLAECQSTCSVDEKTLPCEQPIERGPCEGDFERYYYDNETDVCRPFSYGGCKGNKNNYPSEAACSYHCKQPGVHKELCSLPKETGDCSGNHARWYYSDSDHKCMPFYYTGCGQNKNNFHTLEQCEANCPKEIAKSVCEIPAEVGECQNYTARWYYDTKDQRCRQFYYGGCGGNGNNFAEEQQCLDRCEKQPEPEPPVEPSRSTKPEQKPETQSGTEKCFQSADTGPCREFSHRWYYNHNAGICEAFVYGGCDGNENNFKSEEECDNTCGVVQQTCSLRPYYGKCDTNVTRWYYDERSERCNEFTFSGCGGNKNNFVTERECLEFCRLEANPEPALPPQCELQIAAGDCAEQILSYFYNAESGNCEAFYYTGCGGNANRYETKEQCHRQCGEYRDIDVCQEPYETGPCHQWVTRYYYDSISQRCKAFTYGGCEGTGNRFTKLSECESVCIVQEEPVNVNNTDVCKLEPVTGRCTDLSATASKRWYYDDSYGTCLAFIYSGCSGNQNNFRTFESCIDLCSNLGTKAQEEPEITNEIDKCEETNRECSNIRCQFGTRTYEDNNGCRRCECEENPCRDYECPEGSQCAIDIESNSPSGQSFVAVCREENKPGECPQLQSNSTRCNSECRSDADCRGNYKCCEAGCANVCVGPYVHREEPITQKPRRVVYPQDVEAALEEKPQGELDVETPAGGQAVLNCFATGNPPPTITWRRGEIIINTNEGRFVVTTPGKLTIVQVEQSDSGSYICIADNGLGRPVQRAINLVVSVMPPKIKAYIAGPSNSTLTVTLSQPAVLRCPAGGIPKPTITWWRDRLRLPITGSNFEYRRDFSLLFRSIQLRDLGPYTCEAYTGYGRPVSTTVVLQAVGPVHNVSPEDQKYMKYIVNQQTAPSTHRPSYPYRPTRPTKRPPPPPLVIDSREQNAPLERVTAVIRTDSSNTYKPNSDLLLNCDVSGSPQPNVTWYKDNIKLLPNDRIQITVNPHRVIVYGVNSEDSGYYACSAQNEFSDATSTQQVNIQGIIEEDPNCVDNPYFANCNLIVLGKHCSHKYYRVFCCKSCTRAGQLPIAHQNNLLQY